MFHIFNRANMRATLTHTQRWHASHGTIGTGHLYQGRFKSFPIQTDEYFLTVCRYAERNALRANLVSLAEDWAYGSLYHRLHKTATAYWSANWNM